MAAELATGRSPIQYQLPTYTLYWRNLLSELRVLPKDWIVMDPSNLQDDSSDSDGDGDDSSQALQQAREELSKAMTSLDRLQKSTSVKMFGCVFALPQKI